MRISIFLAALLTSGMAVAQQMPSNTGSTGPIVILKNIAPEPGGLDVRVNGREVGRVQELGYDDITSAVHPGSNTLIVAWSGPIQQLDFKVAYAPTRNNFRNLLVVNTGAAQEPALRQRGSRTFVFTLPN